MKQARTYAGMETFTDHRLVVMEYEVNWTKMYSKINKKTEPRRRIDTYKLVNDSEIRKAYQEKLEENVKDVTTWDEIRDVIQEVAEEVVGYSEVQKKGEVTNKEIKQLSNQQKEVRMMMGNVKEAEELKQKAHP